MKFYRILLTLLVLIIPAMASFAIPANRVYRIYEQPDGTKIKIKVVGDEYLHFTLDENGRLLHLDDDGFYRLGEINDDGAVVSIPTQILSNETGIKLSDVDINRVIAIRDVKRKSKFRAKQTGLGRFETAYPSLGNPKGLIILVQYSDVKFNTSYDAKTYFTNMINGENFTDYGATGSALQYFKDQSQGKFSPSFDVLGPVTLPNPQAYYGKNDIWGEEPNAPYMVTDALDILDKDVDFSIYDNDKDGILDNVYIIYAGLGEANGGSPSTVWPHSWNLSEADIEKKVDGVLVGSYACSNEWTDSRPDGIGAFVHEFSHVMGLPDLYNTINSEADYTPWDYSVLDGGPYNNDGMTPPNYGAYEKNAMGWFEPIVLDGNATISLNEISSGQFALIPTEKNTEFFLLENRQQTGWDTYIPNHGLLIWHIDYDPSIFNNNVVNNKKEHQYVDIVEANNNPSFETMDGYTFPGTTRKTSFTSTTTPALKSWSGKAIDLPITDITEHDGIITFDVCGGASALQAPTPKVIEYSKNKMYFIAEWPPVPTATDYRISVFGNTGGGEGSVSTGFDNSKVPSDWNASSSDYYTTNTNFGSSSPSFKFSKDNQTLTSPITEGDITKIEFWAKGQSSAGTYLTIEGLKDGKWVFINQYTPLTNKSETALFDTQIPAGIHQVRFTMSKSSGNIAVDDIVITYGGGSELLKEYDNVSTGGATSFTVDKLLADVYNYYFTVTASDGISRRESKQIDVILDGEFKDSSAVLAPFDSDVDDSPIYYNLQGVRIDSPSPGMILIEQRGTNTRKVIF